MVLVSIENPFRAASSYIDNERGAPSHPVARWGGGDAIFGASGKAEGYLSVSVQPLFRLR